jgi:hypothetical protein
VRQDFSLGAASNITWQRVEGDNFTAKGGVLRKVGGGRAGAASVETITHSAIANQGVSWRVGATGHDCEIGLRYSADEDFTIETFTYKGKRMCLISEHGETLSCIADDCAI